MRFPRYPEYKDSGVEWLGEIPSEWEISALKHLVAQWYSGGTPDTEEPQNWAGEDDGYPWVSIGDITKSSVIETTERRLSDEGLMSKNLELLPAETVLVSMYASVGKVSTLSCPAAINQAILGLRPSGRLEARFLVYWLQFMETHLRRFTSSNTQENLNAAKVKALPIYLPSQSDQRIVAGFLDRETAKIDALVAEQERLIALLKEKRQVVISHSVTKGLDPNVPMMASKDNGFTIPSHWDVIPLNRLIRRGTTITYGIVQAGPDVEGGVPYIRTSDMSGDALREGEYLRTSLDIDRSYSRSKVEAGDLVVAIRASVGKALIVPPFLNGANLTQGTARVAAGDQVRADFLVLFFQSDLCQGHIQRVSKGTTFQEITLDALRKLPVAVPPIDEQEAIVDHVYGQLTMIRSLHECSELAIGVLTARRAALITAAVTGQIDVRGLAPTETA